MPEQPGLAGDGRLAYTRGAVLRVIQEQDAGAGLSLALEVGSESGLSAETLNQRIVEGLEQLGITASWEPA